jgi:hypothetical protein
MARANQIINPQLGTPRFIADFRTPDNLAKFPAKCDVSQFRDKDAVKVLVNANAAQNATSVTIIALAFTGGYSKVPKGTVLYFGGQKVATLTADYVSGTALTVSALPTALVTGDIAYFLPAGNRCAIPAGTLVGRTYGERDASTSFGPAAYTDDEFYLLAYDVSDAFINNNIELLENSREVSIYENYLPQWTALSTTADEVDTVAVTGTVSAGKYVVSSIAFGKETEFAYNASAGQISTALEAIFGAGKVTYTGTDFTAGTIDVAKDVIPEGGYDLEIDISGATGATAATVTKTTVYASALLDRLRKEYHCLKGVN